MKFFYLLFLSFFSFSHPNFYKLHSVSNLFTLNGIGQGTTYTIKYISADSLVTKYQIDSILHKIDSSLSLYKPYSLINRFNNSKNCLEIDLHFKQVTNAALKIAFDSYGSFDPTCKPVSELWGFGSRAHQDQKTPTNKDIQALLHTIGYQKIFLNNQCICKTIPSVKLDFDGIAQGYTVDILSDFLTEKGLHNFIVELGGEIRAKGMGTNRLPWTVGIEDPSVSFDNNYLVKKRVVLNNAAITTSGNYRKFIQIGKDYFSHIIDPIKGRPVQNGIISVTVLAENATLADGWDNAFMVMGIKNSIEKADSLKNIGVYLLFQDKEGNLKDTCNTYFKNSLLSY